MKPSRDSGAWAVALAQHVEPRLETPWRPFGLVVGGFLASLMLGLAVGVAIFGTGGLP